MPLGERARFGLDAEEPGDEILDVRRQRDQEVGLFACLDCAELLLADEQASVQAVARLAQKGEEGRVDAQEAFALVQIARKRCRKRAACR